MLFLFVQNIVCKGFFMCGNQKAVNRQIHLSRAQRKILYLNHPYIALDHR